MDHSPLGARPLHAPSRPLGRPSRQQRSSSGLAGLLPRAGETARRRGRGNCPPAAPEGCRAGSPATAGPGGSAPQRRERRRLRGGEGGGEALGQEQSVGDAQNPHRPGAGPRAAAAELERGARRLPCRAARKLPLSNPPQAPPPPALPPPSPPPRRPPAPPAAPGALPSLAGRSGLRPGTRHARRGLAPGGQGGGSSPRVGTADWAVGVEEAGPGMTEVERGKKKFAE